MNIREVIIPLLISALIGYITNDIAIKMLFHPRKAYYIGKWRVPFTPGLIPKEKDRVAKSIGQVISTQLLNSEVVSETLTSEEMVTKVRGRLEGLVEENRYNEATVEDVLLRISRQEAIEEAIESMKQETTELLYKKLVNIKFGENIARTALNKVKEKAQNSFFSLMSSLIDDEIFDTMAAGVGELIDRMIDENAEETIGRVMDKEIDTIKDTRICDLIAEYEEKIPGWIDFLIEAYKTLVSNNIKSVLEGINLSKIVEDRVASFDVIQLENMIFGIMDRELKAIVYLGALLGFLMGFVNLFV